MELERLSDLPGVFFCYLICYTGVMSHTLSNPPSATIQALIGLIGSNALKRGTFRLASGREASFYLDAKQVVLDSHGSMLVGRAILERLTALTC